MPHPNNKQNKNTNPILSRQEYHLTQPCPLEEKRKTLSINLTLNEAYTNHCTNLRRAETKRKKEFKLLQGKKFNFLWSLGKEDFKHSKLKKDNEKAEKYYTDEETQIRNTEVQTNEEEIGKIPEKKNENNDRKDDQKLWKQNGGNARIN